MKYLQSIIIPIQNLSYTCKIWKFWPCLRPQIFNASTGKAGGTRLHAEQLIIQNSRYERADRRLGHRDGVTVAAVVFTYGRTEIDAEYRRRVALVSTFWITMMDGGSFVRKQHHEGTAKQINDGGCDNIAAYGTRYCYNRWTKDADSRRRRNEMAGRWWEYNTVKDFDLHQNSCPDVVFRNKNTCRKGYSSYFCGRILG